jgi:hypothetical protein
MFGLHPLLPRWTTCPSRSSFLCNLYNRSRHGAGSKANGSGGCSLTTISLVLMGVVIALQGAALVHYQQRVSELLLKCPACPVCTVIHTTMSSTAAAATTATAATAEPAKCPPCPKEAAAAAAQLPGSLNAATSPTVVMQGGRAPPNSQYNPLGVVHNHLQCNWNLNTSAYVEPLLPVDFGNGQVVRANGWVVPTAGFVFFFSFLFLSTHHQFCAQNKL